MKRPLFFLCLLLSCVLCHHAAHAEPRLHALALGDTPKYPPGFVQFDYVNPDAPRGGSMRLSAIGSFDTFNGFLPKGIAAAGAGLLFDTLTVKSLDEPFTEYGLVAESMELAADNTWIIFHLRPEARFHDGVPLTARDVAFTFETLLAKGSPVYKQYYADVEQCEVLNDHAVKFSFKTGENRELPLILGQLTVLPRHYWETRDFAKADLEIPLGSGAYKVEKFEAGRSVSYVQDPNYWGRHLPVNRGGLTFERIAYEYYRDSTVAMEAFKAGEYDYREENVARQWATGYTGPAFDQKLIVKQEIPDHTTYGLQGMIFNTRREVFKDPRVREALAYAFDFEWSNENLFHGQYVRSASYFSGGELASSGLPSPEELALLEPWRGRIPDEVFTSTYQPPSTKAPGSLRENLKKGLELLQAAGWQLDGDVLKKDGKALQFEYLERDPAFERIMLPFVKNLERMGVKVVVRMVDTTQWLTRIRSFDFDMSTVPLGQSDSPGNEQRYYFHSQAADMQDSMNLMGVKDPAVDALVEAVISAKDRKALVAACHALDRVLLWGHYVIPCWHNTVWRVAAWDKFDRPAVQPKYAVGQGYWWVDVEKRARILKVRPDLTNKGF
ncbi:extracellular solute-binding protein [Megalodesulfovibrio gigas]|uniref:Putative family 5 extracellular solute-binding protein n=1 Tax=Megalodesulfovibrio gigas (strain ATCC 19364 / DSM 1382 / NCIMB 9332 / VKM B-1759) TaxID=1121448 RepID=T2GED1_MEGG1|nr:extracellular solute-binding protein [Megalodesulfovibrio gigas]AGW14618.1 putative family 5 extracellular solute-binding protein [Megalodesulfovibrio gigas DSM 1382 = ATCC 19364]